MIGLKHALRGLKMVLKEERNFRVELFILAGVIIFGYILGITKGEWLSIFLISALVLSLEIINSAIERVCNLYSTEVNPAIKTIKDMAAAAVLLSAVFAALIGIYIFYPYLRLIILQTIK